ncbi:MAG TPA: Nif3-like dinuclear metal center hexameric protein, partial [bacterium]|nr:Nif3-like dinuclear metal center hexameric protein [bacterium]
MVPRDDLIQYLNDYLQVDQVKDYCPIGLQVEGKEQVHRIVTAVSAGAHLFQQAAEWQADMIIVHHGLFWDRDPRVVRGPLKSRLKTLLQNDITLLGYHLALDKHPVLGNNALAAQALGLEQVTPLGEVGVQGRVVGLTIAQL